MTLSQLRYLLGRIPAEWDEYPVSVKVGDHSRSCVLIVCAPPGNDEGVPPGVILTYDLRVSVQSDGEMRVYAPSRDAPIPIGARCPKTLGD